MDTLLHTYRSEEDEEEIPISNPNPNPNSVQSPPTQTHIVSDPVHILLTNTQMQSDPVEKTQIESDQVHNQIRNSLMEYDIVEKAHIESDPVLDQVIDSQKGSDPVCNQITKTQMVSDPAHYQVTDTHVESDNFEKTQMESDPDNSKTTDTLVETDPVGKTQMESDPDNNQITDTQVESDPVEKTQMESDPVQYQPAETQVVSDSVDNKMMNTQMESDPDNNQITDTQMETHTVEKTRMEIEPDKKQSEPELMVVEEGGNVNVDGEIQTKGESLGSEEVSTDSMGNFEEEESPDQNPPKKQKSLSQMEIETTTPVANKGAMSSGGSKKKSSKKKKSKGNNVWTKPTSRKGKKKAKNNNNHITPKTPQDMVYVAPIPRFPDRNDDSPDAQICLSKFYKAEKVEISEDRLSASSSKGYRMVRATRGVTQGAWYFEIKVVHLGETGHTRLGWSNEKGDLQAPVGYDANSFGYRDIDGSKIHKALREKYGDQGYKEGDVIGFYINLPLGDLYAPKPANMVWYKGQKFAYAPDTKNDPKIVPGSEISFFKNGVSQGVAYKDLSGGCYYPAASMYTLPNQPNCTVKFNFGPDFEYFPTVFEGRPTPSPMIEVPYHGFDNRVENGVLDDAKM